MILRGEEREVREGLVPIVMVVEGNNEEKWNDIGQTIW
jgi:hypothetical protein